MAVEEVQRPYNSEGVALGSGRNSSTVPATAASAGGTQGLINYFWRQTTPMPPIPPKDTISHPVENTTAVIRFIKSQVVTKFITRISCISHPRSITHRVIIF